MATTISRKPLPTCRDVDNIGKRASPFPNMPILYLEFIENPNNVKRDLVGKDYVPPSPTLPTPPSATGDQSEDEDEVLKEFRHDRPDRLTDDEPPAKISRSESPVNNVVEDPQLLDREEMPVQVGATTEVEKKPDDRPQPPSLAELRAKNQARSLTSSDYKYPQEDDDETIKKRNDVFFHYEVLKKMHPSATIPEFSVYSDPEVMAQKYEFLAKKLSLDSSVENWKRYMIIFVMGCEVGLGKLNFDMEGFAQQQISSMNTYDQLLIEMAEKSYVPSGNRWPVEVRLMMMLTMNVVLFVVSKMIFKKTGTNLLGSINEVTGIKIPSSPNLKDPSSD